MAGQRKFSRPIPVIARLFGALILAIVSCVSQTGPAHADGPDWENCPNIHFVQKGETLGLIALYYGIKVNEIMDANDLFPPYYLWEWQPLCIPRIAFRKLYPKASFSANVFLNNITIWGAWFPSGNSYKVKIRAKSSTLWKLVGYLSVNPDGTFDSHFQLPKSLSDQNNFQICLKEQVNGYNACVTVDNRWVSGRRIKWNGEWITIPER